MELRLLCLLGFLVMEVLEISIKSIHMLKSVGSLSLLIALKFLIFSRRTSL